jgi:hypothetical protein
VLLWPSRVEGHATIPWEARSVGCVPVALSTNRFAVGLEESAGALTVGGVDELAGAVRKLVTDQDRWTELSQRGVLAAEQEVNWNVYLERVRDFLGAVPGRQPGHEAAGGIGSALSAWQTAREADALGQMGELAQEEERVRADRDRLAAEAHYIRTEHERLSERHDELHQQHERLVHELETLRTRRSVKLALGLSSTLERARRRPPDSGGS